MLPFFTSSKPLLRAKKEITMSNIEITNYTKRDTKGYCVKKGDTIIFREYENPVEKDIQRVDLLIRNSEGAQIQLIEGTHTDNTLLHIPDISTATYPIGRHYFDIYIQFTDDTFFTAHTGFISIFYHDLSVSEISGIVMTSAVIEEEGDITILNPIHTGNWIRLATLPYQTTTITFSQPLPIYAEFVIENTGEGTIAFASDTVEGSDPVEDQFTFVMSSLCAPTITGSHRVVLAKVMPKNTILLTGTLDDL